MGLDAKSDSSRSRGMFCDLCNNSHTEKWVLMYCLLECSSDLLVNNLSLIVKAEIWIIAALSHPRANSLILSHYFFSVFQNITVLGGYNGSQIAPISTSIYACLWLILEKARLWLCSKKLSTSCITSIYVRKTCILCAGEGETLLVCDKRHLPWK